MLKTTAEDLHLFRSSLGFLRSVPTKLTAELVAMNQSGASLAEVTQKQLSEKSEVKGTISGDYQNEYINAGSSISFVKEIRSAKAVVEDLMQDFM